MKKQLLPLALAVALVGCAANGPRSVEVIPQKDQSAYLFNGADVVTSKALHRLTLQRSYSRNINYNPNRFLLKVEPGFGFDFRPRNLSLEFGGHALSPVPFDEAYSRASGRRSIYPDDFALVGNNYLRPNTLEPDTPRLFVVDFDLSKHKIKAGEELTLRINAGGEEHTFQIRVD